MKIKMLFCTEKLILNTSFKISYIKIWIIMDHVMVNSIKTNLSKKIPQAQHKFLTLNKYVLIELPHQI